MKLLATYVCAFGVNSAFWTVSLRRTPFAAAWFALTLCSIVGCLAVGFACAADPHDSLAGTFGLELVSLVPAAFCVLLTECTPHDAPAGAVASYRKESRPPKRRRRRDEQWAVATRWYNGAVELSVRCGEDGYKLVGSADPIADEDAFMELQAKAEQAAETLNALRIGS